MSSTSFSPHASSSNPPAAVVGAAVVGGGLAGLTAALELARAGKSVTLFEQSRSLGGRAKTRHIQEFSFNLGPRALYCAGHGRCILDELGIAYHGEMPTLEGGSVLIDGDLGRLPTGAASLALAGWLDAASKIEVGRFFAALPSLDAEAERGRSTQEWLEGALRRRRARELFAGYLRLTSYCADFDGFDAGDAIAQLQAGLQGVLYLDGGWQTLVDNLRESALQAGVRFATDARVKAIEHDSAVRAVVLADGARHEVSAAILAVDPTTAARLANPPVLRRAAELARPLRAASLDVGLRRLPEPSRRFALGVDEPYYVSVHSAAARLAPAGSALIHVMRYLEPEERLDRGAAEAALEGVLSKVQPGWREELVERQLLPQILVGYLPVRNEVSLDALGVRGLQVAGDWAAEAGMLADAAMLSARHAARRILAMTPELQGNVQIPEAA